MYNNQRLKKSSDLLGIPRIGPLINRDAVVQPVLEHTFIAEPGDGAGLDFFVGIHSFQFSGV